MKNILLFLLTLLSSFSAAADLPLNERDSGTFVILDQSQKPTGMYFRLSKKEGQWVMDGKKKGGDWVNISCDTGCAYRDSSYAEVQKSFPPDLRASMDISCIQNRVQMFCRYSNKGDSASKGYLLIALVTKPPVPILLSRVSF